MASKKLAAKRTVCSTSSTARRSLDGGFSRVPWPLYLGLGAAPVRGVAKNFVLACDVKGGCVGPLPLQAPLALIARQGSGGSP